MMLLISKVQEGGTNGTGESWPLTQHGSCLREGLVLTCPLKPTLLQEATPVAGLI